MEKEVIEILIEKNILLRNKISDLNRRIYNFKKSSRKWVSSMSMRAVPSDAVVGGSHPEGYLMFVGRAKQGGHLIPAQIYPHGAVVTLNKNVHEKVDYEILCGKNYRWIQASDGKVPPNAMVAGQTLKGEPLYIGRADYENIVRVGKVQPSEGGLLVGHSYKEIKITSYEVLTESPEETNECSTININLRSLEL